MELLTVLAGIYSCVAGKGAADGDEAPAGGAEMPVAEQYAAYIL